jgi:hypothetical protein
LISKKSLDYYYYYEVLLVSNQQNLSKPFLARPLQLVSILKTSGYFGRIVSLTSLALAKSRAHVSPYLVTNHTTMTTKSLLPRLRPLSKSIAAPLLRPYHSYDHPPPPGPFTLTESSILSAAIPHIPTHGFTHTTLSLGTKDAGYIDASTNLFPNGAFSLVHYHLYTQRLALAKREHVLSLALKEGEKPLGVGGKVKALSWERLMGNREIIHRWQEVRTTIGSFKEM